MQCSQLHVPGCTSISPEGIIRAATLLTRDNHRLTTLKIDGIYGLQTHHLHTLRHLVNHNRARLNVDKILYQEYGKFSTLEAINTSRPIDLDICPKCGEVRMLFDCPRILCQQQECRGCTSCITRCAECSVCLKDVQEIEDAACADALCLECWLKLPKCSFCNKPYCSRHKDRRHGLSGSVGFICDNCHFST